jgi:hypothetical protein
MRFLIYNVGTRQSYLLNLNLDYERSYFDPFFAMPERIPGSIFLANEDNKKCPKSPS